MSWLFDRATSSFTAEKKVKVRGECFAYWTQHIPTMKNAKSYLLSVSKISSPETILKASQIHSIASTHVLYFTYTRRTKELVSLIKIPPKWIFLDAVTFHIFPRTFCFNVKIQYFLVFCRLCPATHFFLARETFFHTQKSIISAKTSFHTNKTHWQHEKLSPNGQPRGRDLSCTSLSVKIILKNVPGHESNFPPPQALQISRTMKMTDPRMNQIESNLTTGTSWR